MHSLLVDSRAYTDARHETWHFSGSFRPMLWTEGFDGQTYRAYGRHPPEQQKGGYAWISSARQSFHGGQHAGPRHAPPALGAHSGGGRRTGG